MLAEQTSYRENMARVCPPGRARTIHLQKIPKMMERPLSREKSSIFSLQGNRCLLWEDRPESPAPFEPFLKSEFGLDRPDL